MAKPLLFQAFLLFWLLGVSIAQPFPPSILIPLYSDNTCSSASGTVDNQITGNATLDQYYGWGFYPRCVIENPPQELPSNWTYRCLGIPVVQNDTSYFAYPDNSPCTCSDGCYNYTDGPPAEPIFYSDDEVKVWDVTTEITNPSEMKTVINTNASTNGADDLAQGQIVIGGLAHMLASMHPRSGWKILDCQKHPEPQKLLAYCSRPHHMASWKAGNDSTSPQCRDVFRGEAKNTIVILPDGCGSSLIARVASLKPTSKPLPDSERQALGVNKAKQITVYELEMDYKFDEVPNDEGNVTIAVDFSNLPEYMADVKSEDQNIPFEDSLGLNGFGGWKKWFKKVTQYSVNSSSVFLSSTTFTQPLIDATKSCNGFTASLYADVTGEFRANVKFGYKLVGTIVPMSLTDHYIYLEVDPSISVMLGVYGLAKYYYDSGEFPLFRPQKIPRLNYDPVISFSPYVSLSGQIQGTVQLAGSFRAKVTHNFAPIRLSLGSNMHDIDNATNRSPSPDNGGGMSTDAQVEFQTGLGFTLIPEVGVALSVGDGRLADARVALQGRGTIGATVTAGVNSSGYAEACFSLDSTIDLSWIVSGRILNQWDAYSGILFSKAFPLYKKCIETSSATIPAITRRDGLLGNLCPKVTEDLSCSIADVSGAGGDDTDPPTNVSSARKFPLMRRHDISTTLKFCGVHKMLTIDVFSIRNVAVYYTPVIRALTPPGRSPQWNVDHVLEKSVFKNFMFEHSLKDGPLCKFMLGKGLAALIAAFQKPQNLIYVYRGINKLKGSLYSGENFIRKGDSKESTIKTIERIIGVIHYLNYPVVMDAGRMAMDEVAQIFARYDAEQPGMKMEKKWKRFSKESFAIMSANAKKFAKKGRKYIKDDLTKNEKCYLGKIMRDYDVTLAGL